MPCALSQSIRRFTSAITSGPMPSPGRSSSLWVAMVGYFLEVAGCARSANAREADWQAGHVGRQMASKSQPAPYRAKKTDLMTPAILFAFASAVFFGAGIVTTQLG